MISFMGTGRPDSGWFIFVRILSQYTGSHNYPVPKAFGAGMRRGSEPEGFQPVIVR